MESARVRLENVSYGKLAKMAQVAKFWFRLGKRDRENSTEV